MLPFKLILYVSLFVCVAADLNKDEGDDCVWDGVKGICVNSRRCLTSLATRAPKHPLCSTIGEESIICCTDCELTDDTGNVVTPPRGSLYFKDGRKARDHCLDYWNTLPYSCAVDGGYYGGIGRDYDRKAKCHRYSMWAIGGSPPIGIEPPVEYPHQALIGFGEDLDSVKWLAGGSIISDRYILTAAHINGHRNEPLKYVALGVRNRTASTKNWQIREIESVVTHPEYKPPVRYNDIALLKLKRAIQFTRDVVPACLTSEKLEDEQAVATTWRNADNIGQFDDTIRGFNTQKYKKEDCSKFFNPSRGLPEGYDEATQMCYGNKKDLTVSCKGLSGEPLMVNNYLSDCFYTIIGITSFGGSCHSKLPDVYTRVSHYLPWIESVVWP